MTDFNLEMIERQDIFLDLDLQVTMLTAVCSKRQIYVSCGLEKQLYFFTELHEDDGEIFYIHKKTFNLPQKPYFCLRIADEIYIGCDFCILVFDIEKQIITHNQHST